MSGIVGPRLPPGAKVGPYEIEEKLGEGGFGVVYVARDGAGKRHALKHLAGIVGVPPKNMTSFLSRFRREARVSRSLVHPGIVEVEDHGVEDGVPYMLMRLLRGRDLEAYVKERGALDPRGVVALAIETCDALAHAHENGVVHRDLKPANVFVEALDTTKKRAIVCDFGIAKTLDDDGESLTETGALLGTALFMSPEQLVDAGKVDPRSDVWSLGMTLYAALAGRSAFEHVSTWTELVVKLATETVPSLHEHAPWVPASVVRAVHAALLRDPAHRFASMRALRRALARTEIAAATLDDEALGAARGRLPEVRGPVVLPSSALELDEGRVLGKYRLGPRLGEGGMGEVFEATCDTTALAVKVLKVPEDPVRRKRFAREIAAIERIESPYVTRLVDTGIDPESDAPYLVMERLVGRDLGRAIEERGALSEGPLVHLFVQACAGVTAAHAIGLVHRDLKPSNLYLAETPGDDTLVMKVCDFGIAKTTCVDEAMLASTELTEQGRLLGSPAYMSPEQAKSAGDVDVRSDVYSLGLSLHQALSGVKPWPGKKTAGELIVAVCTEDAPRLADIAPWVSPALASVVHHAIRRDRAERYATVEELARALAPFAAARATLDELGPLTDEERAAKPLVADADAPEANAKPLEAPASAPTPSAAVTVADASGSVVAPRQRASRRWVGGLALAAVPALGLAVIFGARTSDGTPPTAPNLPPPPSIRAAIGPLPSAPPSSAGADGDAAGAPTAPTSAGTSKPHGLLAPSPPRDAGPRPRSDASAPAPSTDPIGRGVTATELPLAPKPLEH